jgi:hypothetical protein
LPFVRTDFSKWKDEDDDDADDVASGMDFSSLMNNGSDAVRRISGVSARNEFLGRCELGDYALTNKFG